MGQKGWVEAVEQEKANQSNRKPRLPKTNRDLGIFLSEAIKEGFAVAVGMSKQGDFKIVLQKGDAKIEHYFHVHPVVQTVIQMIRQGGRINVIP